MAADVKFNGLLYPLYEQVTSNHDKGGQDAKGRGIFDVQRMYWGADITVDEHWGAKLLLEGNTGNTTNAGQANNAVFLKQAYIAYSNLMGTGININFGQIPTVWNYFEDSLWNQRYIRRAAATDWGFLSDSDKGVRVQGSLPMGYGSWDAVYVNGEGTQVNESATDTTPTSLAPKIPGGDPSGQKSRGKDYGARASITPLPQVPLLKNLQLHGVVWQGVTPATFAGTTYLGSHRRDKWLAAASYKHSMGQLLAEYWETRTGIGTTAATNISQNQKGFSVSGSVNSPWWGLGAVARYDRVDLAPAVAGGVSTGYAPERMILAGVTETVNPNVRFAVVETMRMRRDTGDVAVTAGQIGAGFKETKTGVYGELKF